jgi:transposase InsO family protein
MQLLRSATRWLQKHKIPDDSAEAIAGTTRWRRASSAILKIEQVYQTRWRTRAQARSDVFEYIEIFYNRQRRHSALGYLCPDDFERQQQRKMAA